MAGQIRVLNVMPGLPPYDVGLVANERRLSEELIHLFWELVASGKVVAG